MGTVQFCGYVKTSKLPPLSPDLAEYKYIYYVTKERKHTFMNQDKFCDANCEILFYSCCKAHWRTGRGSWKVYTLDNTKFIRKLHQNQ
jgi:hypothetical protein